MKEVRAGLGACMVLLLMRLMLKLPHPVAGVPCLFDYIEAALLFRFRCVSSWRRVFPVSYQCFASFFPPFVLCLSLFFSFPFDSVDRIPSLKKDFNYFIRAPMRAFLCFCRCPRERTQREGCEVTSLPIRFACFILQCSSGWWNCRLVNGESLYLPFLSSLFITEGRVHYYCHHPLLLLRFVVKRRGHSRCRWWRR
uniref:Uncharacterized protein TCIL3000_3_1540 n=1 Tax=Trypanosoma congolense (strain IL3000) TaxID=1068625 RepID=G0UK22_TRYCI|nr:unnamed protein product [Trypanosoma congolense IL3000]